jgi:actin, other eukaryote
MYENQVSLVLDNGSGVCKIGYSADDAPKSVFPSIVGKPRMPGIIIGIEQKDSYIGEEAQSRRGVLNMTYPIEHGVVKNWDDMEKVWTHAFANELRIATDEHHIFITEASLNPKQNREKMTQIMFDKFNINSFYVGNQSVLSLYSIGKLSGLVLYSGDGVTHSDPIFEGYSIPHATHRIDLGGRDITNLLVSLLFDKGTVLSNSAEREIVRDIKEKLSYIALDYPQELKKSELTKETSKYQLPDDNVIEIGNEKFTASEVLFNPEMFGFEHHSIDELIYKSILDCDIDFRRYMFENVILSGGNTMFNGIVERLTQELSNRTKELKNQSFDVKVKAGHERKFSAWVGGSILCGLSSFQQSWVTKAEYEETGPSIIHRKCLS